ncbi:MAG: histidine kinase, partial [Syntrophus sp. (in: bacteria)]|nr:histidine kinase [Syntrophus sp. (in: bacteria)]
MKKTSLFERRVIILLMLLALFAVPSADAQEPVNFGNIGTVKVVTDDNYPPYVFRDEKDLLQGIIVDQWALWEKKTGVQVILVGMDWEKAKQSIAEDIFDVIDTFFFTQERSKTYDYAKPYATLDVPIFFHKDISGIKDIRSLQGFTVGVKSGDACIEILKKNGIHAQQEFPNYESIIRAAAENRIKVFCVSF